MTLLECIKPELESFKTIVARMGLTEPTTDLRNEMKQLIAKGLVTQVGNKKGAKYKLISGAKETSALIKKTTKSSSKEISLEDDLDIDELSSDLDEPVSVAHMAPSVPHTLPPAPVVPAIVEPPAKPTGLVFNLKLGVDGGIQTKQVSIDNPIVKKAVETNESSEPAYEWVEPGSYCFVKYLPTYSEMHREIIDDWMEFVKTPGTITQVAEQVYKGIIKKHGKRAEPPWRNVLAIANAISDLAQMNKIRVRRLLDPGKYLPHHQFGPWLPE